MGRRDRITSAKAGLVLILTLGACQGQENSTSGESGNGSIDKSMRNGQLAEINMLIPADQLEAVKQSAALGSNPAARRLAGHYFQKGQSVDETRWLTLAADRGDCASMSRLRESATERGDRQTASRWNEVLRQHECTWGKAYPEVSNPEVENLPLSDDE